MIRKLLALTVLLALVIPGTARSQAADTPTFETVTVGASSIGLTATTYYPTDRPQRKECLMTLAAGQVRWRDDGTDPTSTVGHIADIGGQVRITGHLNMKRFRAIRTGGTSGILSVTCW